MKTRSLLKIITLVEANLLNEADFNVNNLPKEVSDDPYMFKSGGYKISIYMEKDGWVVVSEKGGKFKESDPLNVKELTFYIKNLK